MPKADKPKYNYPFPTKRQIKDKLATNRAYLVSCFTFLHSKQTVDEQATSTTKYSNRHGWMSSHAVRAGKLSEKLASNEMTDEDFGDMLAMVTRYGKQLAAMERKSAMDLNPELRTIASIFIPQTAENVDEADVETVEA